MQSPFAQLRIARLGFLVLLPSAFGCRSADAPVFRLDGKPTSVAVGADSRQTLALTVYNDGFGLIRETRGVKMPEGRVDLAIRDVTTKIDARTVALRSISNPGFIQIFEQSYRYDLLGPQSLLEKYVGKKIRIYRKDLSDAGETASDAEVVSTDGGTVFRLDGEYTTKPPGRLAFPGIPEGLVAKPTLVVSLGNAKTEQALELTYMSSGFSWRSDYVLSLDDQDEHVDVMGWVTLENHTGAGFEDTELRLVAGDVKKILDEHSLDDLRAEMKPMSISLAMKKEAEKPAFKEERLFEYHLYALQRKTTLLDNEQKQIALLESHATKVRKTFTFEASASPTRVGATHHTNAQIRLEIDNKKENGLGIPLPKGRLRLFKKDKEGASHLIGDDTIDHTSEGEPVKLLLGNAFDLVGERKHLTHKILSECITDNSYSIEVRNHRNTDVVVEILEPIAEDWTITANNMPFVKKDAHTIAFTPNVPKDGKIIVTYAVRAKTC